MPDTWWMDLEIPVVFMHFIIENAIGLVDSSAGTEYDDEIAGNGRFKPTEIHH